MTTITETVFSSDNNSTTSKGIYKQHDGTYLVMIRTTSKTYKTLNGAIKAAAKMGIELTEEIQKEI